MTRTLISDYLRRNWTLVVVMLGLWLMLVVTITLEPTMSLQGLTSRSMSVVIGLGVFLPYVTFSPREVQQLPASRRTIWVAGCVIAVGASVAVAAIAAVGLALAGLRSLDLLSMVTTLWLLCLLYSAALFGLAALLPTGLRLRVSPRFEFSAEVALIAVFVLSPVWPRLLPFLAPARLSDFTPATWAFVVIGVALGAVAWRHHPVPAAHRGRSALAPGSSGRRGSNDHIAKGGSTGLALLLITEARTTAVYMSGLTVVSLAIAIFAGTQWRAELHFGGLLPFVRDAVEPSVTAGGLFLFLGMPGVATVGFRARSLRALPMSSTKVAIVIMGIRLLQTVAAWTALAFLYVVAVGRLPDTLRVDLLSVALGVAALSNAAAMACGRMGAPSQIASAIGGLTTATVIQLFHRGVVPRYTRPCCCPVRC